MPVRRTPFIDLSSLETVAVELVFDRNVAAAAALEAASDTFAHRPPAHPFVVEARLDDPTLERGIRALAARMSGALRAKRFVVLARVGAAGGEELDALAELCARFGIDLGLAGEGDALVSHLGSFRGRVFAVALSERTLLPEAKRAAAAARRAGAPLLVRNIATFDHVASALTLGARYAAGPALEAGLRLRLVAAARARLDERERGVEGIRATEEEVSQVRTAIAADPDAQDLARITTGWLEPLDEARREVERAEKTEARARSMVEVAERDLATMLESYAFGNAQRAERLLHCEASFLEARALEAEARLRAESARNRAFAVQAAFELRKEALRAALEARASRLAHASDWPDRFFPAAS